VWATPTLSGKRPQEADSAPGGFVRQLPPLPVTPAVRRRKHVSEIHGGIMAEVSPDATLIIATSWQALKRAEDGDERTSMCNCTIIIVFAAFFIEANLNHFIDKARGMQGISAPPNDFDGLQSKIAWVYNSFVAREPITDPSQLRLRLEAEFPGINAIREFRNNVSHGIIDRSVATLSKAKELRIAAKAIVDRLLSIAEEHKIEIQRGVEYEVAINTIEASNSAD
jgi:hypothetical protein